MLAQPRRKCPATQTAFCSRGFCVWLLPWQPRRCETRPRSASATQGLFLRPWQAFETAELHSWNLVALVCAGSSQACITTRPWFGCKRREDCSCRCLFVCWLFGLFVCGLVGCVLVLPSLRLVLPGLIYRFRSTWFRTFKKTPKLSY